MDQPLVVWLERKSGDFKGDLNTKRGEMKVQEVGPKIRQTGSRPWRHWSGLVGSCTMRQSFSVMLTHQLRRKAER